MARPTRKERPSRVMVQVRLTVAELAELDQLRRGVGLTRSDFIRRRALGRKIITPPGVIDLSAELGRIGNNLNQMTRLWQIAKRSGHLRITEARATKLEQHLDRVLDAVQRAQVRLWDDQEEEDDQTEVDEEEWTAEEGADADR